MQIAPQENFPIVYLIGDPFDATTYYVQAIIRDSGTGATLITKNLTNGGSRRFSGIVQAPSDPSGLGRFIDVTTSVYTDSGYTTKSQNYEERQETYLVTPRWSIALGGGVGGGVAFDYEKIRTIFLEVIADKIHIPAPVDISSMEKKLIELAEIIADIKDKMPQDHGAVNFAPLTSLLLELGGKLDEIGAKEMPKLNLAPVISHISRLFPMLGDMQDSHETFHEFLTEKIENLDKKMDEPAPPITDTMEIKSPYMKTKKMDKKIHAELKQLLS